MVQYDGRDEESVGDKMKNAARNVKDKLEGKSKHDSLRDHGDDFDRDDAERRLTLSEEELAVDKRRVPAGEVRLSKSVETEHVREDVPVMREEVIVERHAVADGARADNVEMGEEEITIPVTEEEVVAEKRAVVKEEIVARKREVEENRTVEADLRQETVDIDDQTRTKGSRGSKRSSSKSARAEKRSDEGGRSTR
jgi:uncharacterized protein (TIGR02271 family)